MKINFFDFISFFSLILNTHSSNLTKIISENEKLIQNLTKNLENSFKIRCDEIFQKKCSYSTCAKNYPEFNCYNNFKDEKKCSRCFKKGMKLFKNRSSIKFSPNLELNDQGVEELIIASSNLDDLFKNNLENHGKYLKWQYFASSNGFFRIFPGRIWCEEEYDSRFRSWYVSATTGRKNLVIILDISSSMQRVNSGDIQNIEFAKQIINFILKTLTHLDFLNIILFNQNITVFKPKLSRANSDLKKELTKFIQSLTCDGLTNFEKPFSKAFDLLNATITESSGCQNLIIFFSDGYPNSGPSNEILIEKIKNRNKLLNTTIFAYSFGSELESYLLKRITCATDGIFQLIYQERKIHIIMDSYFLFLAISVNHSSATWIEPYIDASGLGKVATISMPVYYRSGDLNLLIGVMGIDILVEDFPNFEKEYISYVSSVKCAKKTINSCELEAIRHSNGKCDIFCNNSIINKKFCKKKIQFSPLCHNQSKDLHSNEICCGNNMCVEKSSLIASIVVPIIFLIMMILGYIYFRYGNTYIKKNYNKQQSIELEDNIS